jgi:hypothetical protein
MSSVLDAFVGAAAAIDVTHAEPLQRELETAHAIQDERENAIRSFTAARRAMHRATGDEREGEPITDGAAAFRALEWAAPIRLTAADEQIQEPFLDAVRLATDHLGPLPGGRLAAVRDPSSPPALVEEVRPSQEQLVEMSRLAGTAVGAGAALGKIDPVAELRRILVAE